MGRVVDADIDPADVFSENPQHQHDHAADQHQRGDQGAVPGEDFGVNQFVDDVIEGEQKAQNRDQRAQKGGDAEGLDREGGEPVHP